MESDDESIVTMFKSFVHDRRISKLKTFWGVLAMIIFVIGFFLSIGIYQVKYCKENFPGRSIKYCMEKIKMRR